MKNFRINDEQMQIIANTVGEFPAKQVINVIDLLRALPEIAAADEVIAELVD